MIYVVQGADGGPVKIGYTSGAAVTSRLASLQLASPVPLRVLLTLPGRTKDEFALHRRFDAYRLHGEWFEPAGDLLEWLHEQGATLGVPHGPLVPLYQAVLDALDDQWRPGSDVAARSGIPPFTVGGVLASLERRWERAESRTRHHTWTPYQRDWRDKSDARVMHAGAGA